MLPIKMSGKRFEFELELSGLLQLCQSPTVFLSASKSGGVSTFIIVQRDVTDQDQVILLSSSKVG